MNIQLNIYFLKIQPTIKIKKPTEQGAATRTCKQLYWKKELRTILITGSPQLTTGCCLTTIWSHDRLTTIENFPCPAVTWLHFGCSGTASTADCSILDSWDYGLWCFCWKNSIYFQLPWKKHPLWIMVHLTTVAFALRLLLQKIYIIKSEMATWRFI